MRPVADQIRASGAAIEITEHEALNRVDIAARYRPDPLAEFCRLKAERCDSFSVERSSISGRHLVSAIDDNVHSFPRSAHAKNRAAERRRSVHGPNLCWEVYSGGLAIN